MTDEQTDEPKRCEQRCAKGAQCTKVAGHTAAGDAEHFSDDGCIFYDQRPVRIADPKAAATFRYCDHCGGAIPPFAAKCPCHPDSKPLPPSAPV